MELEQHKKKTAVQAIAALCIALCIYSAMLGLRGLTPNPSIGTLWGFSCLLLALYWIIQDARQRGITKPYTSGFIMAALWPFLIPAYAYTVQRGKGLLVFLGLLLVLASPDIAYLVGESWRH